MLYHKESPNCTRANKCLYNCKIPHKDLIDLVSECPCPTCLLKPICKIKTIFAGSDKPKIRAKCKTAQEFATKMYKKIPPRPPIDYNESLPCINCNSIETCHDVVVHLNPDKTLDRINLYSIHFTVVSCDNLSKYFSHGYFPCLILKLQHPSSNGKIPNDKEGKKLSEIMDFFQNIKQKDQLRMC